MAFNRTDTRQRAYNRIDSSQPQGNWIDEASYNKGGGGKCLMGNWVEERNLQESMGKKGYDMSVHRVKKTDTFGADRGTGGFASSAFIINQQDEQKHWALDDGKAHFMSTAMDSFNAENSNIDHGKKANLGIRRQMRLNDILDEAAAASKPADDSATKNSTKYWGTTARDFNASAPSPEIFGPKDSFDYADDVPISLYTGNPSTGAKMSIQGKSAGTGRNPFAKNANFSTPIDRHPTGGKHQTLEY